MLVVFDLDGTLCDIEHRLHHIKTKPKDFSKFLEECPKDEINDFAFELYRKLVEYNNATIVLASGRSLAVRDKTEKWLAKHGIKYAKLYMRKLHDYRQDFIVKKEILDEIVKDFGKPDLAVDDRQQVVDMWRHNGIMCIQVAEGNF